MYTPNSILRTAIRSYNGPVMSAPGNIASRARVFTKETAIPTFEP
jgi:hypothetical protein